MTGITEDAVEQAMLVWLAALGWQTAHGPDISPTDAKTPGTERDTYGDVALRHRLAAAIAKLNPNCDKSRQSSSSVGGTKLGGPLSWAGVKVGFSSGNRSRSVSSAVVAESTPRLLARSAIRMTSCSRTSRELSAHLCAPRTGASYSQIL